MTDVVSDKIETPENSPVIAADQPPKFYVVAPRKFWLLYMLTLGLYGVAWFYQNWAHFKRATYDDDVWPAPRGLFNIFFAHSLGRQVEATIKRYGTNYEWDSTPPATLYVIASLASWLCDRLASNHIGNPITDILTLALIPVAGWQLFSFQRAINAACRDPEGVSNSRMNWVNWTWMIIGAVVTPLALYGTYLTAIGEI